MSEVTFAKSFLSQLDRKPIKLAADHVSDPRKYPNQSPFTLPRQTHPYPRKSASSTPAPAPQNNVTATLKPMRSGSPTAIPNLSLDSSIHDIKTLYAQQTSTPQDKIKLLLNKKPANDLKTLRELGVSGDAVEVSVMILGGSGAGMSSAATPVAEKADPAESVPTAPAPADAVSQADKMDVDEDASLPGSEKAQAEAEKSTPAPATAGGAGKAAAGPSGPGALNTGEFWTDLQDFLTQRLGDGEEAEKLIKVFKIGWINSKED